MLHDNVINKIINLKVTGKVDSLTVMYMDLFLSHVTKKVTYGGNLIV